MWRKADEVETARRGPAECRRGRHPRLPGLHYNPETGLHEAHDGRHTLHASALGLVEHFSRSWQEGAPNTHTSMFRVSLLYLGASYWSVGSRTELIDPNRAVLMRAGKEFSSRQAGNPIGRAGLLISPSPDLLDEVCRGLGTTPEAVSSRISTPATMRVRMLTQRFLMPGRDAGDAPLCGDERMIALLGESIAPAAHFRPQANPRLINRAKEVLHGFENERVSLREVAALVGTSPVYLLRLFRQAEGIPLCRYHRQLRLSRALGELRTCEDITTLAHMLGFSSHSHFTSAFHATFGLTPSDFRALH